MKFKIFEKRLIFLSVILFIAALIVHTIIRWGFDYLLLVMFFGPLGWPLKFYSGGSFMPFIGGGSSHFSILNLLFDIIAIYMIVFFSDLISIKINKNSKKVIFILSFIIFFIIELYLVSFKIIN